MQSPVSDTAAVRGIRASGLVAELDHVGIAVPDLDRAAALYGTALGCPVSAARIMPDQGIAVVFVDMGAARLELIAPIGAESPITDLLEEHTIQHFLARQPAGGLHHVCYSVPDLSQAWESLRRAGLRRLGKSGPIIGASGRPIMFLDPGAADGVLIELKGPAGS